MKKLYVAMAVVVLGSILMYYSIGSTKVKAQCLQSASPVSYNKVEPFETKFWNYLQASNYKNWAPGAGQNGDFYPGESPHGAFLKMYLNRSAAADQKNLPHGSIIIKENYSQEKKLMAITVMSRHKGYDPEHNNWHWVKYMPDGTVAKAPADKGGMKLVGKVKGCIMCHGDADGDDFAFIND